MASPALASRIARKSLLNKVATADDCVKFFQNGQYLGWSGFTGVGYPKVVPIAIAKHVKANNLEGKWRFSLFCGASTGSETEDVWATLDMIERRYPFQVGKNIAKGINEGRIKFSDKHLSEFPQDLLFGYYTKDKKHGAPGKLDIAIVEATAITEGGHIIPGASVGASPELLASADKIIIELNTSLPNFSGLHDISSLNLPPYRLPFPIVDVDNRIGTKAIPIDPEKIIAIVESNLPDNTPETEAIAPEEKIIASHIVDFLQHEVKHGRLPSSLLPLQSGIGAIANAVVGAVADGPFEKVKVWTEVFQDGFMEFIDKGKLDFASATSIRLSPSYFKKLYGNWDHYSKYLLLRSQEVANNPELIRRMGVIAMNTPVEFDVYGHANSTMVAGSRMLNGLGGSGDFLRNAKLSIMHTPSSRPTKKDPTGISCVVPFASHIDHTEHDLDVYVTEQGLADLRGLCPRERAREIIDKCAHPDYKPILTEYLNLAETKCIPAGMAHIPHLLDRAFKMHHNLLENGTMKIDSW